MHEHTASSEPPCVWLSISHIKSDLLFGFRSRLAEEDSRLAVDLLSAFKRGVPCDAETLPAAMWVAQRFASDNRRKLPHLFVAGGFLAVSEAFAEVVRGFDLGRTRLFRVELLHSNRTDPFPGRYYILNIAEVRRHFSVELSAQFERMPSSSSAYVASIGNEVQDGDITVSPAALEGPDLWIDDTLLSHFFCSDRLARALRAAKVASRLPLFRCRIAAVN